MLFTLEIALYFGFVLVGIYAFCVLKPVPLKS